MSKKKSKEKVVFHLYDNIETVNTIICSKCGTQEVEFNIDVFEAADSFYEKGWYATSNNIYCPRCRKKYTNS